MMVYNKKIMLYVVAFAVLTLLSVQGVSAQQDGLFGDNKYPVESIQLITGNNGNGNGNFVPLTLVENNSTNMSDTARNALIQVANRFQHTNRERLNCTGSCFYQAQNISEDVVANGEAQYRVSTNKPVRFLGFDVVASEIYTVNDQGDIVSRRNNFFEFARNLGIARENSIVE